MTAPAVQHAVDAALREERGRVVAALIRRTGDWDLAEECAQEVFTEAPRRWPRSSRTALPAAAGHA
jgi:RNA polymerase sigma-70 factor (ECF subfamily)